MKCFLRTMVGARLLHNAAALLPQDVRGSAAAGWLHLEDWMYCSGGGTPAASFPFDEVATPKFLAQGRVFPSLVLQTEEVDPWASEGALTRQTRINLGYSNHSVSSEDDAITAGTQATIAAFRHHRDSYYDESDFLSMQKNGINTLRVPLGWWTFASFPLPEQETILSDW